MLSKETKEKISKSRNGYKAPQELKDRLSSIHTERLKNPEERAKCASQKGVPLTNSQKKAIDWTGRKHMDEAKEKMRTYRLNNPMSREAILKGAKTRIGQKRTLVTRDKISAALTGKKLSDLCMERMKEKNSRLVLNTDNGIFYSSLKEACVASCLTRDQLGKRINKKIKTTTNFIYV